MAYTAWSVVFGEQPTAAKWNQLGENDAGFKDGTNIDDDAVIERHILDGIITPDKMNFGAETAEVDTGQTTTSTSWADLATAGPSVTVTVPASGKVLILWGADVVNSSAESRSSIGVRINGADPAGSTGQDVIQFRTTGTGNTVTTGRNRVFTGLTPGSTIFKMRYQVQAGTGTFAFRHISAIPIGD